MLCVSEKILKVLFGITILGYGAFCVLFWQLPDDKFHIMFLDVGQGDSIFIKTPQNHQILIDGGPDNAVIEELGGVMPFFNKSIDLVVLTHPHADHINGLVEVLERFKVENVLLTGVADDEEAYIEFLSIIDEKNVRVFIAEEGTDFLFNDVLVDVLYPFESIAGMSFDNLNNSSVVVRVVYEENEILLTGDLEMEGEEQLVEEGVELEADILKAGHHGSKTASGLEFLGEVGAEVVVISCGLDNKFGHPHEEVMENFALSGVEEVRRTDLEGTVEIEF
jgi:competence protein ComEC